VRVLLVSALALPRSGSCQSEFIPNSDTGSINETLSYHAGTPIADDVGRRRPARRGDHEEVRRIDALDGRATSRPATARRPAVSSPDDDANSTRITARRPTTSCKQIRTLAYLVPGAVLTVAPKAAAAAAIRSSTRSRAPRTKFKPAPTNSPRHRAIPGTVNVQTGAESETNRLNINIDREVRGARREPGRLRRRAHRDRRRRRDARAHRRGPRRRARAAARRVWRNRLADVENIKVRANDGVSLYRLSDLASFTFAPAPTKIERARQAAHRARHRRLRSGGDDARRRDAEDQRGVNQPGFFPERRRAKAPTAIRSSSPRRSAAWASRCSPRSRWSTC
jgi:multidrug efflux pump subunit AcrB